MKRQQVTAIVEVDTREMLSELLEPRAHPRSPIEGAIVGSFVGIDAEGSPLVEYEGQIGSTPMVARSTVSIDGSPTGTPVVLVFEGGRPERPIVVGLLRQAAQTKPRSREVVGRLDGDTVRLTAEREIVLECGKASITLTRAGKVLIRGAHLLSRSSGVNRIKGGSVQVN